MSDAAGHLTDLEIRERLARIDQLTADAAAKRQEWGRLLVSALTTGAALLGAGAAIGAAIAKL